MTVFTRRLQRGIIPATYIQVDRENPLGTVMGDAVDIKVIIDEGGSEDFNTNEYEHNSQVLIYVLPETPIERDCVGGWIDISDTAGKRFRIESYNVGKNQRTGLVEHIELVCTEQL
jgi:hypothetical protein